MKNLRKALAAVIGLSVMAMSVSAFAEVTATGEFTSVNSAVSADYTEIDQNKVSATVDLSKAVTGTEMTYLILNNNVTDSAILAGSIAEGDILYIDQKTLSAGNDTFTGAINLSRVNGYTSGDELPVGSYPIRVGYYYDNAGVETFAIATATMVVAEAGSGETTVTLLWGDLNGDGYATTSDALELVYKNLGSARNVTVKDVEGATIGNVVIGQVIDSLNLLWGDLNGDGYATTSDALELVYKNLGSARNVTVKDADGETIGDVVVGNTIDVTYSE